VPFEIALKRGRRGAMSTDMQNDIHGAGNLLEQERAKRRGI
jgi:hypothetical protein